MKLYIYMTCGVCVKRQIAVNNGNRYDRAFCLGGSFETSAFEFSEPVSVAGTGSFRKDQKITSGFHLICHLVDDL